MTDILTFLQRALLDALQDVADKAEAYLNEGTNPRRNQLDEAVLKLRRLQGERPPEQETR
jgi:hypothetical protein